jgi:glycosyltransferase involved in cell wall biosynthesis
MSKLTACVVAKDEERILDTSLASIQTVVDEILYVDTGSTDSSLEIAKKYTSHILQEPWRNDFAYMYNLAFDAVKTDYCLLWDADFVLQKDSVALFLGLKKNDFNHCDQIALKWNTQFDSYGNPTAFVYRPLVFRSHTVAWRYPTHSIAFSHQSHFKKYVEPCIMIDHRFDPYKRDETTYNHHQIVLDYLSSHPQDPYMSFALIEEYYTLGHFQNTIDTSEPFLAKLAHFPYPVQLIELVVFSHLHLGNIHQAIALAESNQAAFLHTSRKFDIIYADTLLYTDFPKAQELYKYASQASNYTLEANDEYDTNRLNHAAECATNL